MKSSEIAEIVELAVKHMLAAIAEDREETRRIGYPQREAAELLGVPDHVLGAARRRGEIRAARLGKGYIFSHVELERFAQGLRSDDRGKPKSGGRKRPLRAVG